MCAEIVKAGRPLSAADLSDLIGITPGHAVSECRRQVVARNMHVAIIDYGGGRRAKYLFAAGPAPLGHVPAVIGELEKMTPTAKALTMHQHADSFGRYASVWDYADGKQR